MRSKYGAKKTVLDGIRFDSMAEAEYYLILKAQKLRGEIADFILQPKIYLSAAKILFKPDYLVINLDGSRFFVDVKGMMTPVFKLKLRLWKAYCSERLLLVKKSGRGFKELN